MTIDTTDRLNQSPIFQRLISFKLLLTIRFHLRRSNQLPIFQRSVLLNINWSTVLENFNRLMSNSISLAIIFVPRVKRDQTFNISTYFSFSTKDLVSSEDGHCVKGRELYKKEMEHPFSLTGMFLDDDYEISC